MLELMPEVVCIKAGGIDDKAVRDFGKTNVEFYCKDRLGFAKAVEGGECHLSLISSLRDIIDRLLRAPFFYPLFLLGAFWN